MNEEETIVIPVSQFNDLKAQIERLLQLNQSQSDTIQFLNLKLYKPKTEKTFDNQPSLFDFLNETDEDNLTQEENEIIDVPAHTRVKKKHPTQRQQTFTNEELDKYEQEYIHYRGEEHCNTCDTETIAMTERIRRELAYVPGHFKVLNHIYEVKKCVACNEAGMPNSITNATIPAPVIPKSPVGATLIVFLIVEKFMKHVPIYRLEKIFKMQGMINLSRQTMVNWLMFVAFNYFKAITDQMFEDIKGSTVIMADETKHLVIEERMETGKMHGMVWSLVSGKHEPNQIVLYMHRDSRKSEVPQELLDGFDKFLQTDGYTAYKTVAHITLVMCFAHVRRKFNDAYNVAVAAGAEQPEQLLSWVGRDFCNRLFEVERQLAELPPSERFLERIKLLKPILDEFKRWCEARSVVKGSPLGKAVNYTLDNWQYLYAVLYSGELELSTNRVERKIKDFVLGRKNWMFSYSKRGAEATCIIISLVQSAIANNLDVWAYLEYLLTELPQLAREYGRKGVDGLDISSYLPYSPNLPEHVKIKQSQTK